MKKINKNVLLYIISTSLLSFSVGIFTLVFNLHISSIIRSKVFLSNFLLIGNISMALGGAVFGRAIDRFSKKNVLQCATFFSACMFIMECFITHEFLLLFISFGYGMSFSIIMSIHTPLVMEYVEENNQAHVLNICNSLKLFASTMGIFIGGFIPRVSFLKVNNSPYQLTLIAAGVTYLSACVPLFAMKDNGCEKEGERNTQKKERKKITMPKVTSFSVSFLILGLLIFFSPYMNIYLKNRYEMDIRQISLILTIIQICPIVTNILLGKLFDYYSTKKIMFSCIFFCLLSYVGLAFFDQFIVQIVLLIGTTILSTFVFPQISRLILKQYSKENVGQMAGIANLFYNIGDAIGTYSEGIFINYAIYYMPFMIAAVLYGYLMIALGGIWKSQE